MRNYNGEKLRGVQRKCGEGSGFKDQRLSQTCIDVSFQSSGSMIPNKSLSVCKLPVLKDLYQTRWIQPIGVKILVLRACQTEYALTFPVFSLSEIPGSAIFYIIIFNFKTPTCMFTLTKILNFVERFSVSKPRGILSCNILVVFPFMDDL